MARTPKYRKHSSGRYAMVELDGKRFMLGKYDSPESRAEYHRLIAEWEANGRRLVRNDGNVVTVAQVIDRFEDWAKTYYRRKDGTPTGRFQTIAATTRLLGELYGHTLARDFGPACLHALRHAMIQRDLKRKTINDRIGVVRKAFRLACDEELIPAEVWHRLAVVEPLKPGRSMAKEGKPVKPVPQAHIDAVLLLVTSPIRALIGLQLLTGARAGELVIMRAADIDKEGEVWIYRPPTHKTAHRGRARPIPIGPKAQEILKPFLRRRPFNGYLFSPEDALNEHYKERHEKRKTPISHGNRPGSGHVNRKRPVLGERYTTQSYGRAIKRACERAGLETHWTTHQLRHSAATIIRAGIDAEAARVILGHSDPRMTEVYAEKDLNAAIEAARQIG